MEIYRVLFGLGHISIRNEIRLIFFEHPKGFPKTCLPTPMRLLAFTLADAPPIRDKRLHGGAAIPPASFQALPLGSRPNARAQVLHVLLQEGSHYVGFSDG